VIYLCDNMSAKISQEENLKNSDNLSADIQSAKSISGKREFLLMKNSLISSFQRDKNDVGSPEVQIAVLTYRIANMTRHFDTNKKDNHSRRGLIGMINRRKKLLKYLTQHKPEVADNVVQKLSISKVKPFDKYAAFANKKHK